MKNKSQSAIAVILLATCMMLSSACNKKADTIYSPLPDECWNIEIWTGLSTDSMLTINAIVDVPEVNHNYVKWLKNRKNHVQIRSLISENFEDLKCMDEYLDGIRIIQLGESNHGTKEYNQIKVRMIKYLHEVHGFNVIAFESGFFDCAMGNINSPNTSIEETVRNSIFNVWQTEELVDLFYYMKYRTNHSLTLAGFDCQDLFYNNNRYHRGILLKQMASYIDPVYAQELYLNDIEVTQYMMNPDSLAINRNVYKSKIANALNFINANYITILDSISANKNMIQILSRSLLNTLPQIDKKYFQNDSNDARGFAIRDSAMAANIVFLAEEMYPNEKIIIWAHNAHINYDLDNYNTFLWDGVRLMGNWLYEYYPEEMYTIALYSLRGEFGWVGDEYPLILPTSPNSIEAIFYWLNRKYLFFDLKNHPPVSGNEWFDEMTYARQFDQYFDEIYLRKEFDGVIVIDSISIPDYLY